MLVEYAEHRDQVLRLLDKVRQLNPICVMEFTPQMAAA
jgi:hypothetical protein